MFNDDPRVVSLVASVLPLVALFQVFDGLSETTAGILRARGRQVRQPYFTYPNVISHRTCCSLLARC